LNAEVSGFQRNFVNEVKKCDDMERRLRFFEEQIQREKRIILEEHNQNPEDLHMVHVPETAIDLKKIQLDELEVKRLFCV
jgi:V-type H+-transporting ATPase subunit a